jgi:lysozyme
LDKGIETMVNGFDFSDKNGIMDWDKLTIHSPSFVYLKASEGLSITDKSFNINRAGAKEHGWLVGAYHWLDPKLNCKLQAENFARTLGSTNGELPPAVCLELYRSATSEMERNVRTFVVSLIELVGRKVVIYTSNTYWNAYLPKSEWANSCFLWIDQPGLIFPTQIYPWVGWTFWQTSFKTIMPGINGNVGMNWFNGTVKELQQLVNR